MTITEATHALARSRRTTAAAAPAAPVTAEPVRLAEAMRRAEPSWVEAVAVVQAVCAQRPAGHGIPALDSITIDAEGAVAFGEPPPADDVQAVIGAGQLLTAILGRGDCPMQIWEAAEQARMEPARVGTPAALMAQLTCLPAAQGARELARYYQAVQRAGTSGAVSGAFSGFEMTARAGLLLAAVLLGGAGTGVSVGTYVATRAAASAAPPPQLAALSLQP